MPSPSVQLPDLPVCEVVETRLPFLTSLADLPPHWTILAPALMAPVCLDTPESRSDTSFRDPSSGTEVIRHVFSASEVMFVFQILPTKMAQAMIYRHTITSYFLTAFMTKKYSRHSSHIMSQQTPAQIKSLFLVPVAGGK